MGWLSSLGRAIGTAAKAVGSAGRVIKSVGATSMKAIGSVGKVIKSVGRKSLDAIKAVGKAAMNAVTYVGEMAPKIEEVQGYVSSIVEKGKKIWRDLWSSHDSGNSLVIKARDLNIVCGDDARFWRWNTAEETSIGIVDTAELITVRDLDVKTKFDTRNLSPGISYEVVFLIKLKDYASGWEKLVTLGLVFPNGERQERTKDFRTNPTNEWKEIPVGEFITSSENEGDMKIYLCGSELNDEKKGIAIAGVVIRPKNLDSEQSM